MASVTYDVYSAGGGLYPLTWAARAWTSIRGAATIISSGAGSANVIYTVPADTIAKVTFVSPWWNGGSGNTGYDIFVGPVDYSAGDVLKLGMPTTGTDPWSGDVFLVAGEYITVRILGGDATTSMRILAQVYEMAA